MPEIIILNKYHNHGRYDLPGFVNIMRGRSVLQNKFEMEDRSENERVRVVREFHEWLRVEYVKREAVFNELLRLAILYKKGVNIYLECCCAPKLCHGDVVKAAIVGLSNKLENKNCS